MPTNNGIYFHLVPAQKVRSICKWLIRQDFIMTTFSDDLFFPTEIGIAYEKYEELVSFLERCPRDVGAKFDEIYEFMHNKFQGTLK